MCVLGVGKRGTPRCAFQATLISSVTLGKLLHFSEPRLLGHDTRATITLPVSQHGCQNKYYSQLRLADVQHLTNVRSLYLLHLSSLMSVSVGVTVSELTLVDMLTFSKQRSSTVPPRLGVTSAARGTEEAESPHSPPWGPRPGHY